MDSKKLKIVLNDLLNTLTPLPPVLTQTVLNYCWIFWKGEIIHQWPLIFPNRLVSDGKFLYACCGHWVYQYNLQTLLLQEQWSSPQYSFTTPYGIDLNNDDLYVVDRMKVQVFNTSSKKLLREWPVPSSSLGGRGLKIYNQEIYLIVYTLPQIFVYNPYGKLIKKYGKEESGSKPGQFEGPYDLVVDLEYLYVCDYRNHRIQVITKQNGKFHSQWGEQGLNDGQFQYPFTITCGGDLFYIGDNVGVQVFTSEGTFHQRLLGKNRTGVQIGEFSSVMGLCIVDNAIYVSDSSNGRIQIWR